MMAPNFDYPFELRPLEKEEGGGWLIVFPDLPGCMSDGETPEEAIANGRDAVSAWIKAAREAGREVPRPEATSIPGSIVFPQDKKHFLRHLSFFQFLQYSA